MTEKPSSFLSNPYARGGIALGLAVLIRSRLRDFTSASSEERRAVVQEAVALFEKLEASRDPGAELLRIYTEAKQQQLLGRTCE